MRPQREVRNDGYLTPDELPDGRSKRPFLVPTDPAWYGLLMGALAPLLEEDAWRKYGDLTPEQCAAAWQEIFFSNPPCGCELPEGQRIIRINPLTGHLEELSDDSSWAEPSGDYSVPPVTPREGGTEDDQKCLAAANAANVLETLYESITDSIAHELEAAEAYTALVAAFVVAVGWEFAPIAFALAAFFLAVFTVVYEVIKFIAADVWDSTFTDALRCALYDCASDTDGIVTFDWECTQQKLAAGTDALNLDQLRLFGQLTYLMEVIGGADGLNQAGATTEIDVADCSGCEVLPPVGWTIFEGSIVFGANLVNTTDNVWTCDAVYWSSPDLYYMCLCADAQGILPAAGFSFTVGSADVAQLVQGWSEDDCATALNPGSFLDVNLKSFEIISTIPFSVQFTSVPV
jgi:hypothetical protein